MVAFVISLISVGVMFINFISNWFGLVLAIIALIIGIYNIKQKEKWGKAAVAISIVSIIIFAIIEFTGVMKAGKIINETNRKINELNAQYQD